MKAIKNAKKIDSDLLIFGPMVFEHTLEIGEKIDLLVYFIPDPLHLLWRVR